MLTAGPSQLLSTADPSGAASAVSACPAANLRETPAKLHTLALSGPSPSHAHRPLTQCQAFGQTHYTITKHCTVHPMLILPYSLY